MFTPRKLSHKGLNSLVAPSMRGKPKRACFRLHESETEWYCLAPQAAGAMRKHRKLLHGSSPSLVHPLGQVVASLQRCGDLLRVHLGVLREVLGVLPLEELDASLGVRLTAEVAIRRRLLVLRLAQRQGHR